MFFFFFFFFKQKTAYEIPLCDWSSDVCSSDLLVPDLEIAEIVDAEARRRDAAIRGYRHRAAAPREQLGVTRIEIDHVSLLRVEKMFQHEIDVVIIEVAGVLHAEL